MQPYFYAKPMLLTTRHSEYDAEILDYEAVPAGNDIYGQIWEGYLVLRGLCHPAIEYLEHPEEEGDEEKVRFKHGCIVSIFCSRRHKRFITCTLDNEGHHVADEEYGNGDYSDSDSEYDDDPSPRRLSFVAGSQFPSQDSRFVLPLQPAPISDNESGSKLEEGDISESEGSSKMSVSSEDDPLPTGHSLDTDQDTISEGLRPLTHVGR